MSRVKQHRIKRGPHAGEWGTCTARVRCRNGGEHRFVETKSTGEAISQGDVNAYLNARLSDSSRTPVRVNSHSVAKKTNFVQRMRKHARIGVAVLTAGLLAMSLSACSTDTGADYSKVCKDAQNVRVEDQQCETNGGAGHAWYYIPMIAGQSNNVPSVGSSLNDSGGTTDTPSVDKTVKSGISSKGESVSGKSSFGGGGGHEGGSLGG